MNSGNTVFKQYHVVMSVAVQVNNCRTSAILLFKILGKPKYYHKILFPYIIAASYSCFIMS